MAEPPHGTVEYIQALQRFHDAGATDEQMQEIADLRAKGFGWHEIERLAFSRWRDQTRQVEP